MPQDEPKDTRKRYRINISMSAAEYAEIYRRVPAGERSEWCRERIFMSANFRDPVFDVGARLMASVALVKRVKELLRPAQDAAGAGIKTSENLRANDGKSRSLSSCSEAELRALTEATMSLADELLRETRELRRLIAAREESARQIAPVERRKRTS